MNSIKYVMRWMTEADGVAYIRMFRCESEVDIEQRISEALDGNAVLVIESETFDETKDNGSISADAIRVNRIWVHGKPIPASCFSTAIPKTPESDWDRMLPRAASPDEGGSIAKKVPGSGDKA